MSQWWIILFKWCWKHFGDNMKLRSFIELSWNQLGHCFFQLAWHLYKESVVMTAPLNFVCCLGKYPLMLTNPIFSFWMDWETFFSKVPWSYSETMWLALGYRIWVEIMYVTLGPLPKYPARFQCDFFFSFMSQEIRDSEMAVPTMESTSPWVTIWSWAA